MVDPIQSWCTGIDRDTIIDTAHYKSRSNWNVGILLWQIDATFHWMYYY